MQVSEHNTSSLHRDRSACICMKRVSRTASRSPSTLLCIKKVPGTDSQERGEVQYQNAWLKFYCCPNTEKKFPLRNRQVQRFMIAQLWEKTHPGHLCLPSAVILLFFFLQFSLIPSSSPLLSQVHQRAADVKEALDLVTQLNEGGAVQNMMDGNFDFKQFQVNYKQLNELP